MDALQARAPGRWCAVLAIAAAIGTGGPVGAKSRVPSGAFLRVPARTAASLRRQVRRDPIVSARYRKLFGKRHQRDLSLLFAGLRVRRMPADRIMRVYYTRPGGRQGYKLRRVRRGTIVFAMADGRPLLIRVCGNPTRTDRLADGLTEDRVAHVLTPDFDPSELVEAPGSPLDMPTRPVSSALAVFGSQEPADAMERGVPVASAPYVHGGMPAEPTPRRGNPAGPGDTPKPTADPPGGDDTNPPPIEPPVVPDNPPTPPVLPVIPGDVPKPPKPPVAPVKPVSTPEPAALALALAASVAGALLAGRRRPASSL